MIFLSPKLHGIDGARVLIAILKIAAASIVMGLAAHWAYRGLNGAVPAEVFGTRELARAVKVFGAVGAGMGALALASWALRIEEFRQAMARILIRFSRRTASPPQ